MSNAHYEKKLFQRSQAADAERVTVSLPPALSSCCQVLMVEAAAGSYLSEAVPVLVVQQGDVADEVNR